MLSDGAIRWLRLSYLTSRLLSEHRMSMPGFLLFYVTVSLEPIGFLKTESEYSQKYMQTAVQSRDPRIPFSIFPCTRSCLEPSKAAACASGARGSRVSLGSSGPLAFGEGFGPCQIEALFSAGWLIQDGIEAFRTIFILQGRPE